MSSQQSFEDRLHSMRQDLELALREELRDCASIVVYRDPQLRRSIKVTLESGDRPRLEVSVPQDLRPGALVYDTNVYGLHGRLPTAVLDASEGGALEVTVDGLVVAVDELARQLAAAFLDALDADDLIVVPPGR